MCVLQHTFSTTNTHHHPALYIPHGAVAAVLCVLREAPECEIQRAAVACLHSLMDAYSPGRDLPVAGETVGDGGGRTGVESASGEVPDGAGSGPSEPACEGRNLSLGRSHVGCWLAGAKRQGGGRAPLVSSCRGSGSVR